MGDSLWRRVAATEADLYATLGVSATASDADIQRAWRRRARHTHPDAGGSPADFEQVHLAYLVLSEPGSRARYDQLRVDEDAATEPPSPAATPPNPADLSSPRQPLPMRFLFVLSLVIVVAVGLSYLWPGFTIVTGLAVGAFVLIRYHRAWRPR